MSEKSESSRSEVDLPGPTVVGKIDNIDRDREGQRDNSQSNSSEDPEAGDHSEENPEWRLDADVQLNPWPDLARVFPEGSFHVAEITGLNAPHGGSLSTRLKFGVEGVVSRGELIKGYRHDEEGKKKPTNLKEEYDERQKISCSVKRFDAENKFIQLSETEKFSVEDEQAYLTEEWKAYARAYPHGQDVKGVVVGFDPNYTTKVIAGMRGLGRTGSVPLASCTSW